MFKTKLKALEIKQFGGNLSYQSRHYISRCKSGYYVFRTCLTSSAAFMRLCEAIIDKFLKVFGQLWGMGPLSQSEASIFTVSHSQASIPKNPPLSPAFSHPMSEEYSVSKKTDVIKIEKYEGCSSENVRGKHIRSLNMLLIMSLKIFYGKFMSTRV